MLPKIDISRYVINDYGKQKYSKNSHPDKVGIQQFYIFNFDFYILKLTIGQFD